MDIRNSENIKMKRIFLIVLILVILFITGLIFDWGRRDNTISISNQNGTTTEYLPITVSYPKEGQVIKSPLKIHGKVKSSWFFEGSFPIQIVDTDGFVIASSNATSSSDLMTEDFVDFSSEINFIKPTSTTNVLLILKNDNPSGLPEFEQSIYIPVILK